MIVIILIEPSLLFDRTSAPGQLKDFNWYPSGLNSYMEY
jgi:hypothetical protein